MSIDRLGSMKIHSALLTAVLQAGFVLGQGNSTEAPSEVPYYGLSPPVYPSRASEPPSSHSPTKPPWKHALTQL